MYTYQMNNEQKQKPLFWSITKDDFFYIFKKKFFDLFIVSCLLFTISLYNFIVYVYFLQWTFIFIIKSK